MSTLAKFTIAQYDALIDAGAFDGVNHRRIELIHGELREMSPASPMHDDIISILTQWSCDNRPKGGRVRVQSGLGIPELDSVPEPDIAWIRPGDYRRKRPEPADVSLLIEVSYSSIRYDLGEKKDLYAEAGVQEYWIVDVDEQQIHVFRSRSPKSYGDEVVVSLDESVAPLAAPAALLAVRDLFENE